MSLSLQQIIFTTATGVFAFIFSFGLATFVLANYVLPDTIYPRCADVIFPQPVITLHCWKGGELCRRAVTEGTRDIKGLKLHVKDDVKRWCPLGQYKPPCFGGAPYLMFNETGIDWVDNYPWVLQFLNDNTGLAYRVFERAVTCLLEHNAEDNLRLQRMIYGPWSAKDESTVVKLVNVT